ncbi:MAG: MarR family transcriptional regulator [ANME-2 cluster archaeon]|nr:MarR family transcriptional regulator [ANME-2 cluster archaeon]
MGSDAVKLILQQKPARVLLAISREGGTYASVISREIESTFAHTTNILGKLEEMGLVKFEQDGKDNRVKQVVLTSRGEAAAALVAELADVLDGKKTTRKKGAVVRKNKNVPKRPAGEFYQKLETIKAQIELISKEELDGKKSILQKDYVRIGRRMGPYRRELRKIMETGGKSDVKRAGVLDGEIEKVFGERERLRS